MTAKKKRKWGGKRRGAGRPKGTGAPPETLRRHRVVVFLKDAELAVLEDVAARKQLAPGAAAYEILARSLRRRAR